MRIRPAPGSQPASRQAGVCCRAALVEGANRQKTPNELAQALFLHPVRHRAAQERRRRRR
ncbi:hypothetical protein HEP84_39515 [Streptomyces sp. RLB1-33]|uniref:hypothetical protein n=1 Tax=Streptomyces mirabilis TaxID=68239 RepID=UPI00143EA9C2|nr:MULTISPECIES: hypothetical protein [Streptomyces]QIY74319.1 hypothetical protein HEP84_39515 [Streptomyces sp. RLB1-33]QUW78715.1 hypothetical protein SMIR_06030 [Streptomyces mirabilis]